MQSHQIKDLLAQLLGPFSSIKALFDRFRNRFAGDYLEFSRKNSSEVKKKQQLNREILVTWTVDPGTLHCMIIDSHRLITHAYL